MRRVRPRFTIRWLMILVAIVGVSLAGTIVAVRLTRRANHFKRRAAVFAASEKFFRQMLASEVQNLTFYARMRESNAEMLGLSKHYSPALDKSVEERVSYLQLMHEGLARSVEYCRDSAAHEARMRQKYERAARRPWERVAPDPPPPKPTTGNSKPSRPRNNSQPPVQRRGTRSANPVLTALPHAGCALAISVA